jgi:hypothetical protein
LEGHDSTAVPHSTLSALGSCRRARLQVMIDQPGNMDEDHWDEAGIEWV